MVVFNKKIRFQLILSVFSLMIHKKKSTTFQYDVRCVDFGNVRLMEDSFKTRYFFCCWVVSLPKAPRGTFTSKFGSKPQRSAEHRTGATALGKGVQGGEAPLRFVISMHIPSFRDAVMECSRPLECTVNSTDKFTQV